MNTIRLIRSSLAFALASATFTACGGGATQGPPVANPTAATTPAPGATVSPTPAGATPTAASSASATASPAGIAGSPTPVSSTPPSATPTPTQNASPQIYVVNHTKNGTTQIPSITVYPATATGNVAPTQTIMGSNTGLAFPQFIAVDSTGDIWVTNQGSGNATGTIEEFAPTANGNVAPIATITGLNTPEGIFIDAAGHIYVDTVNMIFEYAKGTTGANPTPIKSIGAPANAMTNNSAVAGPYGLRVDASGNIYVAQEEAIYVFTASQSGNVAPNQNIAGAAALFASDLDVALDSAGNIYCTNFDALGGAYTINEYAPTATGNTAPSNTFTSTTFDQPIGITFDTAQNIYIANYGNSSVSILTGGSTGAATAAVISGAATGLMSPYGIAVH